MPDFNKLYSKYNASMEDFWSRRANAPKYERTVRIFGHPVIFDSNHPTVLDSATMAEQMYSISDFPNESTWRVHLTVHNPDPLPAPPPKRLVDLVHFAGSGDWLSIDMGEWGSCFADMKRGEAHAVLSSSLADQPEQICLVLLNTVLTNFVTRHGYSMLHASALVKDDHLLLLQAPHGTGKSTTALRLILNGYKLLSDSMVYIGERGGELWMGGFPIGRIKLRSDMLPLFPELAAEAKDEPVRDEIKHRVELNRVDTELTYQNMIKINRVEYCLLERWAGYESKIEPLTEDEFWPEIMVNSLLYDTPELWNENLRKLELLLKKSNLHRLRIGSEEGEILKTVNGLWTS